MTGWKEPRASSKPTKKETERNRETEGQRVRYNSFQIPEIISYSLEGAQIIEKDINRTRQRDRETKR